MTFGEFWPEYLARKEGLVKGTTLAAYKLIWERHLPLHFGSVDMDAVRNSTFQCYVDLKLKEGMHPHAIHDHLTVLKNMLKIWCLAQDRPLLSYTIIWPSQSSQKQTTREKYTTQELTKLIDYCKASDSHFCKVVALGAMTGLRIGELCGIQFGDFDFDRSHISVHRTVGRIYLGKGKTELYVNPPKCHSSERCVPIPSWINQYFRRYQRLYNLDDETYINRANEGKAFVEPRTFRAQFMKLCANLGIPYRSFHSLRHTYASRLLQAKVDIRTTAELLGHADVTTTLNTYAHSDEDAKRLAAKKIFI